MTIDERKPCIYIATSKTTGKSYIGQSKGGINYRRASHYIAAFSKNRNTPFAKALRELGKNDFEWRILEIVEDNSRSRLQEKLNQYEKYYIAKYNSYKEGYNANEGGNNGVRYKYKTLEEKEIFRRVGQRLRRDCRRDEHNAAMKARRDANPDFRKKRREYRAQMEEANPELKEQRLKRHAEYMKANRKKRREYRAQMEEANPELKEQKRQKEKIKRAKRSENREAYREAYNARRKKRKEKRNNKGENF